MPTYAALSVGHAGRCTRNKATRDARTRTPSTLQPTLARLALSPRRALTWYLRFGCIFHVVVALRDFLLPYCVRHDGCVTTYHQTPRLPGMLAQRSTAKGSLPLTLLPEPLASVSDISLNAPPSLRTGGLVRRRQRWFCFLQGTVLVWKIAGHKVD